MKTWGKAAIIRALKTFGQAFAAQITVGSALDELNWKMIVSVAIVSAIYSICTSLAGLPEIEYNEDNIEEDAEY